MKNDMLVGSTGFVGSNLMRAHNFDCAFHSTDIEKAYGKKPHLLVYSGVPSEMFTANNNPEKDLLIIENAKKNIKAIAPGFVVLISTVAVYPKTKSVDENTVLDTENMTAYGKNRYLLEQFVETEFENHLIVRLPAIFGTGLKKNFLYDYINRIPALLKTDKFNCLSEKSPVIKEYYEDRGDGFFRCKNLSKDEKAMLKKIFTDLDFTALNFTDSRSKYQFYPLKRLWDDIEFAIKNGIKKLNLVTPPLSVSEVFEMLEGKSFCNELAKEPFDYNIKTVHAELFGDFGGYIMSEKEELEEIKSFVFS